ncbi:MAG: hypothetical protein H6Q17_2329 [Bacteroidetes bacterium]|nr:hypothetical protein [Bacteroidota bacterium]
MVCYSVIVHQVNCELMIFVSFCMQCISILLNMLCFANDLQ